MTQVFFVCFTIWLSPSTHESFILIFNYFSNRIFLENITNVQKMGKHINKHSKKWLILIFKHKLGLESGFSSSTECFPKRLEFLFQYSHSSSQQSVPLGLGDQMSISEHDTHDSDIQTYNTYNKNKYKAYV